MYGISEKKRALLEILMEKLTENSEWYQNTEDDSLWLINPITNNILIHFAPGKLLHINDNVFNAIDRYLAITYLDYGEYLAEYFANIIRNRHSGAVVRPIVDRGIVNKLLKSGKRLYRLREGLTNKKSMREDINMMSEILGKKTPDLTKEMNEIERTSQYLTREEQMETSVGDIIQAFKNSDEVTLSPSIWRNLENTESNEIDRGDMDAVYEIARRYNKSDPDKLKRKLIDGSYERPLILHFKNKYYLVSGNTRLCTAAAIGLVPKVFIGYL